MTSNIGSRYLLEGIDIKGRIMDEARKMVMDELKHGFKPEFLNRIDEIVMFKPLSKDEIIKIIELSFNDIQKRLDERRIKLSITGNAMRFIADEAYSPVYGARPVKRYIQKSVETEIGKMIIKGTAGDGSEIIIDEIGGILSVSV